MTWSVERRFATGRLIERRLRADVSVQGLAGNLGVSAATIRGIEGGTDPQGYTFGFLERYAASLGLAFDELFEDDTSVGTGDVAAAVGALQAAAPGWVETTALAAVLGWEPERLYLALLEAVESLEEVGLRVAWDGDVAVRLLPVVAVADRGVSLARQVLERSGLRRAEARLVLDVLNAGQLSRSDNRPVTVRMVDANVLTYVKKQRKAGQQKHHGVRDMLQLTDEARFNLCLD